MEAVLVTLVLDAGSPLHAASKLCIAAHGALIISMISGIFVDMVIVRRQRMNPLHLDQITIVQEAEVFAVAVGVQGLQELVVAFAMWRGRRHMH